MDSSEHDGQEAARHDQVEQIAWSAEGKTEVRTTLELRRRIRDEEYGSREAIEDLAWRIYRSGDL